MSQICYNNKDRMQAGLICGGWDPYEGGQVYEIPLGITEEIKRYGSSVIMRLN
jgi:hypothetical protein